MVQKKTQKTTISWLAIADLGNDYGVSSGRRKGRDRSLVSEIGRAACAFAMRANPAAISLEVKRSR